MKSTHENSVLKFFSDSADAANLFWARFEEWTLEKSWSHLLLICLLAMIVGSFLCLHTATKIFILAVIGVKAFVKPKEKTALLRLPAPTDSDKNAE